MSNDRIIALQSIITSGTGDATLPITRPRAVTSRSDPRPSPPRQSSPPFWQWLISESLAIETSGTRQEEEESVSETDMFATPWGQFVPMPELRELRMSSFEEAQRFGFPYNVPDGGAEEEAAETEAAAIAPSPPAWLLHSRGGNIVPE
jgi:hypothetical protein